MFFKKELCSVCDEKFGLVFGKSKVDFSHSIESSDTLVCTTCLDAGRFKVSCDSCNKKFESKVDYGDYPMGTCPPCLSQHIYDRELEETERDFLIERLPANYLRYLTKKKDEDLLDSFEIEYLQENDSKSYLTYLKNKLVKMEVGLEFEEIKHLYDASQMSEASAKDATATLEFLTETLKDRHQAGEELLTSEFEFEFLLQTAPDYLLESYRLRLNDVTDNPITDNDLSDNEWWLLAGGCDEEDLESCWHIADVTGDDEFCFTYLQAIFSEREFVEREQKFLEALYPEFYFDCLKSKSQERELESSERKFLASSYPDFYLEYLQGKAEEREFESDERRFLETSFADFYLEHLKVKIDERDLETDERRFLREDDESQSFYLGYLKNSVLNYGIGLLEEDQRSDLEELDDDFLYKISSVGETVLESEHGFPAGFSADREVGNEILVQLIAPDDSRAEEDGITVLGLPTEQTGSEELVSGLKQFFQWAYKNDALTFNWETAEAPAYLWSPPAFDRVVSSIEGEADLPKSEVQAYLSERMGKESNRSWDSSYLHLAQQMLESCETDEEAGEFFQTGSGDISLLMSSDDSGCALVAFGLVNGNLYSRFKVFEPKVDQKSAFWSAVGGTVKENPGKLAMGALETALMVAPMGGALVKGAKGVKSVGTAVKTATKIKRATAVAQQGLGALSAIGNAIPQEEKQGLIGTFQAKKQAIEEENAHIKHMAEVTTIAKAEFIHKLISDWAEGVQFDPERFSADRQVKEIQRDILGMEIEIEGEVEPEQLVESTAVALDAELMELIEDGANLEMVTKRAQRIGFSGDVEALFNQVANKGAEELMELIEDGASLEMVTKRAQRIGFSGDVEALFSSVNDKESEELMELIEDGASLEMVTKRAERIGFTGDVEALFEQSSSSE